MVLGGYTVVAAETAQKALAANPYDRRHFQAAEISDSALYLFFCWTIQVGNTNSTALCGTRPRRLKDAIIGNRPGNSVNFLNLLIGGCLHYLHELIK
jgi:hypothetical protein